MANGVLNGPEFDPLSNSQRYTVSRDCRSNLTGGFISPYKINLPLCLCVCVCVLAHVCVCTSATLFYFYFFFHKCVFCIILMHILKLSPHAFFYAVYPSQHVDMQYTHKLTLTRAHAVVCTSAVTL